MIIIIMRGENFVAYLDGLGGTPVCRGTPVAPHCNRALNEQRKIIMISTQSAQSSLFLRSSAEKIPELFFRAEWQDYINKIKKLLKTFVL
jgi:hypothetical protein